MSSSDSRIASVGSLLRDAAILIRDSGSETPRLDAELLLGHVLRVDRATLLAAPEASVGEHHAALFADLVARRAKGEPVAYVRGIKEFYGLALSVDSRALIPRPETELVVDLGLARLVQALTVAPRARGQGPLLIWDVGTGSGAICVALAAACRRRGYAADIRLIATDSSPDALALAIENAVAHGVADMIEFAVADLTALADARPADILLANLPYVPSGDIAELPIAASFEPVAALDGGPDGLSVIGRLLADLPAALTRAGVALLEIGSDQDSAVLRLVASELPGWSAAIHNDLSGQPRVAELAGPAAE